VSEKPYTFFQHLRLTSAHMDGDAAVITLDVKPEHLSPTKAVHGGVIFSLADTAMGMAIWKTLLPGETPATISASIDYLAPVWDGTLVCEARVTSRGRRIAFTHAIVRHSDGRAVAQVTGSFHIGKASERRAGKEEGEPVAKPD
jgi:acyl-CoA thioesterase